MHPALRATTTPVRARRGFRTAIAAAAGLALAAGLLVAGPAAARPRVEPNTPAPGAPSLPSGVLVELARGATGVQVQETPYGGTAAVLWQNAAGTQVWARLKAGGTWRAAVRLSPPRANATRPSMDIDSDGSLLVGWTERKGKQQRVVARRLDRSGPGARRVFKVDATQGPQVGAGPFHDVVAWTARAGGVDRPFVSVNSGSGFKAPTRIGGKKWPYDTITDTLRVNSDGPQAHLLHLTKDTDSRVARTGWAVLDPTRARKWRVVNDVGPRQRYDQEVPRAPLITFHEKTRVAMVLTNEQIPENDELPEKPGQIPQVRERWSAGRLWVSRHGAPTRGFGRSLELHNPPGLYVDDHVTHLGNTRGAVVAAHTGDQGMVNVLIRSGNSTLEQASTGILSACRPFPEWFLPMLPAAADETPLLACVDNEADDSAQVLHDLADNPALRLAPAATGTTVRATVPDRLVAALVVTEDLAGPSDPVWLYDLTTPGTDKPQPRSKFTRTKAGKVKGRTRVGRTLRARPGGWSPAPDRVTYRWYVGNKLRPGATKRTFKLKRAMRGKKVKVKVTVRRDGFRNRTVTMKAKGRVR